jgi:hypothetical protein
MKLIENILFLSSSGMWFFHCHFMYHLATGLAVVIQVGNDGDWPPVPRNFPRCGNYLPTPYLEDYKPTKSRG